VELNVYDLSGRLIAVLADGFYQPGIYEFYYNASSLPSGIYVYSLKAGNFFESKKMLLLK
jgi:hypothetical protein